MKDKLTHIKELDGARGIAVIIVMLFHFVHIPLVSDNKFDRGFINVLHLGWIGVDLFFVLSGFLITRILIHDKQVQRFASYLGTFYKKRSLRIFPLYYAYLVFIFFIFFPLVIHQLDSSEQQKLIDAKNAQIWFWLYVSNIKQVFDGKFFGASVSHLWSLSIEEQFYLFWPFIIYYFSLKNIKQITLAIIVISPIIRIICLHWGMPFLSIYFFTLTRMDVLATGAFIAVLSIENAEINFKQLSRFLVSISILSILTIYCSGIVPDNSPVISTIGYSLLAINFGSLVLLLQSTYTFKFKPFFRLRFFVFMGKYSYALYLFHPLVRNVMLRLLGSPFIIFRSQMLWNILFILLCTVVSVVVALLSWNLFEKWFLKLKSNIRFKEPNRIVTS